MESSSRHTRLRRWWLAELLAWLACASGLRAAQEQPADGPRGILIPVNGPIGPATSDFFVRQLREAPVAVHGDQFLQ